MVSLLIEQWLGDGDLLEVVDAASVSVVRQRVREVATSAGLSTVDAEKLVTAASELGHNQLRHASRGAVRVRTISRGGIAGVEVAAADLGRGLASVARALAGGEGVGLGAGVSGATRLSDELDIDVRRGEGACLRARKFAAPIERSELGVVGRPCAGETVSGDHAVALSDDSQIAVVVVDGLGHGPEARVAADAAAGAVLASGGGSSLEAIVLAAHEALRPTRGAVLAAIRLDRASRRLEHVAFGNVSVRLWRHRDMRILSGKNLVLGPRAGPPRVAPEAFDLEPHEIIVLASDGLRTQLDLPAMTELAWEHPAAIAEHLVDDHARPDDDVLVAVLR